MCFVLKNGAKGLEYLTNNLCSDVCQHISRYSLRHDAKVKKHRQIVHSSHFRTWISPCCCHSRSVSTNTNLFPFEVSCSGPRMSFAKNSSRLLGGSNCIGICISQPAFSVRIFDILLLLCIGHLPYASSNSPFSSSRTYICHWGVLQLPDIVTGD